MDVHFGEMKVSILGPPRTVLRMPLVPENFELDGRQLLEPNLRRERVVFLIRDRAAGSRAIMESISSRILLKTIAVQPI